MINKATSLKSTIPAASSRVLSRFLPSAPVVAVKEVALKLLALIPRGKPRGFSLRNYKILVLLALVIILINTLNVKIAQASSVIATIKVGNTPLGIAVNSKTNKIAVANNKSSTVSIIEGETNKVITNISVASGPNMIFFEIGENVPYVTSDSGVLSLIDGNINEVGAEISIPNPATGIALDPNNFQTYVISESANKVTLVTPFTRIVEDTQSVGQSPKQIAINPNTFYGYVTNFNSDSVTIIDERGVAGSRGASIMLGGAISVGDGPSGVAINLVTDKVYVTNVNSNTITEIDSRENKVTGTFTLNRGDGIFNIAVDPKTNRLYVTSKNTNELLILDPSGNIIETIKIGSKPSGVAVNSDTNRIYVTNSGSNTVSVIDGSAIGTSSGDATSSKEDIIGIIDDFIGVKKQLNEVRNATAKRLAKQLQILINKMQKISRGGVADVHCLNLFEQVIEDANNFVALLEAKKCSDSSFKEKGPCVPSDVLDIAIEGLSKEIPELNNILEKDDDEDRIINICERRK